MFNCGKLNMPEKRCRICLITINETSSRVDIFTDQNVHLLRQIYSITGVQLTNIYEQPRHMCNTCLMDLGVAIKFRQRCILSQKQFVVEDVVGEVFCEPIDLHDDNENLKEDDPVTFDIIEEVHEEDYDQPLDEDSDSQIKYYFKTTEEIEDNNLNASTSTSYKKPEFIEFEEAIDCLTKSTHKNVSSFVCDECGKTLSNISNFREHKLRHAGIKSFICKFCRKSFTTHKELIRHTRGHTGERPYACKYCSSRFADLGTFRQHERRHTNSRPFKCAVCGKTFFSSSCLSKHRLIHQPVPRTHHCKICDLWFHRPDHLAVHMNCRSHKHKEHIRNMASLTKMTSL